MKKLIFILLIIHCSFFIAEAQVETPIKTHLFLGTWESENYTEKWTVKNNNEFTGRGFSKQNKDTKQEEKMRLVFEDGKWQFCAKPPGQKDDIEIRFDLITLEDNGNKFIFENLTNGYPQRIIYYFSNNSLNARIEGEADGKVKSEDFSYNRVWSIDDIFILNGKILKENFVNKAGKKIDDVFDYFFEINGMKYFIKFTESGISKNKIDLKLNKNLKCTLRFNNGLWDTDNPNVESRIGNFVIILDISE